MRACGACDAGSIPAEGTKGGGAAPLKTAKEPVEKHRPEPYFNFGGRKFFNHAMQSNFYEIEQSSLFQKTLKKFLGNRETEVITRPACIFVRLKSEDTKLVKRIIVFPPLGFTGDEIALLNPHPEARKARVKILGKINPTKKGFKPLIREIKFSFSFTHSIPTEKISAYAKFSEKYCKSQLKSWKNWFYVVKENGWGNFHSLINVSNEWVVALLEKELIDQKEINIKPYLEKLPQLEAKKLQIALQKIEQVGDKIFDDKVFVSRVLKFPSKILVPILIQMLNAQETGKHENCTFFALLLKIARKSKKQVLEEVKRAIELKSSPYYYLDDLENKLSKS